MVERLVYILAGRRQEIPSLGTPKQNTRVPGYNTYGEAKSAMESAGIEEFKVFDGQTTYTKNDYEEYRGKQICSMGKDEVESYSNDILSEESHTEIVLDNGEATVFIDGSCIRNGAHSAKAGYGVFWGG